MNKACLVGIAALVCAQAQAAPDGPSWKPEFGVEGGITFGGGNLLVSQITGQPSLTPSNVSLYSGDTLYMQGYYRQAIGRTGLSLKAAAGGNVACLIPTCLDQLADYIGNDNGPYQFGSLTGDLALEYAWQDGRVGIGRTARTFSLVTSSSSVYAFQDVYLKPAYGWFLEYEVGPLGVRYTHIIYRSNVSAYTLNGSNLGLYIHANYHDEDWYPGGRYFDRGMGMARQGLVVALHPSQWSYWSL